MNINETERLTIRVASLEDAEGMLKLLNQESFINNIDDRGVRTLEEAHLFLKNGALAMQDELGFSIYTCCLKESGEFIGTCGLIKRDGVDRPEIGFALLDEFAGKGYAFEAAKAVLDYAKNKLAITPLHAIVNPCNESSIALLTKLGFASYGEVQVPKIDNSVVLFKQEKLL